jgi:hypothetical protein
MKKRIITMSEYRQMNPYKCGQLLMRLEKCKVKKKSQNLSKDFGKNDITQYIIKTILNN